MSAAKKIIESIKLEFKLSLPKVPPTYVMLIEIFPLQPISSKIQYSIALKLIEKLIILTKKMKHSDEGIEIYLKTLSDLVSSFESSLYKSAHVSGPDMLTYLMDLQGLKQSDLAKELGGQPIVSKILNGERELNIRQIKALAKRFKVAAEVFI